MKRTHIAIGIVGIAITLAAEPACQRLVLRAVHRHHSKATLASWEEWNKTHIPPKPKEILAELDLACPPVNLEAIDTGYFIPAEVVPTWEPIEFEPDVTVATPEVPETGNPAIRYVLTPPFVPYGSSPQPVPEPWTFGMVGLGMIAILVAPTQKGIHKWTISKDDTEERISTPVKSVAARR